MTNSSNAHLDRADDARTRILDAATREFSANGLAGARTERIAESAKVNKALLYYYFRSKDALYIAALESAAARVAEASLSVLSLPCSPGERVVRFALHHFDRIYSQPVFQNLMQQEMLRQRKGQSNVVNPLVEKLFKPMGDKMLSVVKEGIQAGELIDVETTQITYAALGANVFYFLSAPMMQVIGGTNPLDPAALKFRRRVAIEFLGQAIFTNREQGARVATRVLADTPMPPASSAVSKDGTRTASNIKSQKPSAIRVRRK